MRSDRPLQSLVYHAYDLSSVRTLDVSVICMAESRPTPSLSRPERDQRIPPIQLQTQSSAE